MIALDLIGIGTGNPEHVTLAAIRAMREADLILLPRKGDDKGDLADLRRQICATHLSDMSRVVEFDLPVRDASGGYIDGVNDWHDAIAACWKQSIDATLPGGGRVALLVWGDPSLYDSTLRIAARLGITPRVVPGVTSLSVLTAAHAIPLNDLGAPVVITTGRRLREGGWPQGADAVAVMLADGKSRIGPVALAPVLMATSSAWTSTSPARVRSKSLVSEKAPFARFSEPDRSVAVAPVSSPPTVADAAEKVTVPARLAGLPRV